MDRRKVLIVDDDQVTVLALSQLLRKHGYETVAAMDASTASTIARREMPDLIILDVIMKTVLDGLHMSQVMAEDPDSRDTPILMVTSIANSDYAALFPTDEYIHIRGFLSKPISPETLMERVNALLK